MSDEKVKELKSYCKDISTAQLSGYDASMMILREINMIFDLEECDYPDCSCPFDKIDTCLKRLPE